jgi:hypothetical protein
MAIRTRLWLALLNGVVSLCFLYGRISMWAHGRKWPTAEECKQTARLLGLDAESLSPQPQRGSNTIQ